MIVVENGEKHYVFQLGESIDDVIEQVFLLTLENNDWNKSKTAKALGITLRTVRNWVDKYRRNGTDVPRWFPKRKPKY